MDGEDYADAPSALPSGAWTHLAVTAGDGSAVLYVDGVPAGRNDGLVMSPLALGATTHNYLGRSQDTRNPAMDGGVTGFRLYDHVLTDADIADLHAQGR
ncbi:hypothetical protein GCM10009527_006850 [Actinomadura nitritigenes]